MVGERHIEDGVQVREAAIVVDCGDGGLGHDIVKRGADERLVALLLFLLLCPVDVVPWEVL